LSERCEAGSQENRKGKVEFTGSLEIDLALGSLSDVRRRRRQFRAVFMTVMLYRHAKEQGEEKEGDEFDLVFGEPHSFVKLSIRCDIRA
jgi:hypothetical protein